MIDSSIFCGKQIIPNKFFNASEKLELVRRGMKRIWKPVEGTVHHLTPSHRLDQRELHGGCDVNGPKVAKFLDR